VTAQVLDDIGAGSVTRVLLFNKCDRVSEAAVAALAEERPHAWFTSAKDPARTRGLRDRIVAFFGEQDVAFELFVPWSRSGLVGAIRAQSTVVGEEYEDEGVRYQLRAPAEVADELRRSLGLPVEGSPSSLGVPEDEE
jgi:GTP-binding protein HflX